MRFKHKHVILIIILLIINITTYINARDYNIYKVKRGDSLTSISQYFSVDVKEIIKINNIKNPDLILIGQAIKIPVNHLTYVVQKGDYLAKIAAKFNVALKKIINCNNLKRPDKIYTGQKLIIPEDYSSNTKHQDERYRLVSRSQRINYIWPVQGRLSSKYGWRIHPVRRKKEFHTGIDIAVPYGTPVYAVEKGMVYYSGWSKGYGYLVIIKHRDNSLTYYGHNLKLLVKKNEVIEQGRVIALSGNSGVSTGPLLHFEIRINGQHKNPLNYLNRSYLISGFRI